MVEVRPKLDMVGFYASGTNFTQRGFSTMTLRKENDFKVTEHHLPMVLFEYWLKFSLTEIR